MNYKELMKKDIETICRELMKEKEMEKAIRYLALN